MRVGVLHPGAMGSALAANTPGDVYWASMGRSRATAERASQNALIDAGSVASLVGSVDVIISVCPPHAADTVAKEVAALGFPGLYVDANAVAPSTALRMANRFSRFVDGGIVGGPPSTPAEPMAKRTRLYLSGAEAATIARFFDGTNVEARVIGETPGRASALKAGFAAWTKGTSALLLAVAAYSRSQGVFDDLMNEWGESIPELPGRLEALGSKIGRKAWRFEGEMEEIARAFDQSGLPEGFHLAAAEVYARLAGLRDEQGPQSLVDVLALMGGGDGRFESC